MEITPEKYSIPGHLASMCVAAEHPGEELEPSDPLTYVPVRVFVNPKAAGPVRTKNQFPESSIHLIKVILLKDAPNVIKQQRMTLCSLLI